MAHEEWNIFWALPQWGYVHRKDVDPIKQIGPELLRIDQGGEILVRGRDEPGIRAQGARAAEAFKLPFLQDPQQFRLHFEREFPNLIEKHGTPVRQFEATQALRHRPCKRPSLVSEEFTFEQADRNGGAVELDEGLGGAWAELMNGACDQLFARAGLAGDEHGRLGRRDGLYLVQHLAEGGAVAHNVRKVQLTADFTFQIHLLASITAPATFGRSAPPDNVAGWHIMTLQEAMKVCVKHFDNFILTATRCISKPYRNAF